MISYRCWSNRFQLYLFINTYFYVHLLNFALSLQNKLCKSLHANITNTNTCLNICHGIKIQNANIINVRTFAVF